MNKGHKMTKAQRARISAGMKRSLAAKRAEGAAVTIDKDPRILPIPDKTTYYNITNIGQLTDIIFGLPRDRQLVSCGFAGPFYVEIDSENVTIAKEDR